MVYALRKSHEGGRAAEHPRLEGGAGTGKVMKIGGVAEANAARRDLEKIVRAWCEWRAADVGKAASKASKRNSKASAKTTAKKKSKAPGSAASAKKASRRKA